MWEAEYSYILPAGLTHNGLPNLTKNILLTIRFARNLATQLAP